MENLLLAALQWDPHIRGFVIVLAAILILPGSVYLLLATNMGARMGLLLAVTGLSGWMMTMGAVWMAYGIGLVGESPHWKTLEVITGNLNQSIVEPMAEFPRRWNRLPAGDKVLADAQAAADNVLAPTAAPAGGHGPAPEGGAEDAEKFNSPFKNTSDYVHVAGYNLGGEDYFIPGGHLERNDGPFPGWFHKPHYAVVQVQPVAKAEPVAGQVVRPEPDPTKPLTTIVMVRDLGNKRFPPFLVMLSSGIVFAICCWVLHQRDKEIWRTRAATATA